MKRIRALQRPAIAAITAAILASAIESTIAQQEASLTEPRNPIANDSEAWGPSTRFEQLTFVHPGRKFWPNFYDTAGFTNIETWHPQHVVRLPNKDGRAYFMVTQAREHNGYITVIRTEPGMLDPDTDLVVLKGPLTTDKYGVKSSRTPVGSYVWQDVYTGKKNGKINPVGNWNHPGKMDVMGGVLLVGAQNWDYGSQGTSSDTLRAKVEEKGAVSRWAGADSAQNRLF